MEVSQKLRLSALYLIVGLAVFVVSYTMLGQGPGSGPGESDTNGPVGDTGAGSGGGDSGGGNTGGGGDPPETPAPNPTPGGPGADEGEIGPVGRVTDGDKLIRALMFDDSQQLQDLLDGGADPNSLGTEGHSPLHIAVSMANDSESPFGETAFGKMQLLIRHGANPNHSSSDGLTPMHVAAADKTEAIMTALLNGGGDANLSINGGKTPYESAVMYGNVGTVAALKKALPGYVPADNKKWERLQMMGIMTKGFREARRLTGEARMARYKKTLGILVSRGDLTVQESMALYEEIRNSETR